MKIKSTKITCNRIELTYQEILSLISGEMIDTEYFPEFPEWASENSPKQWLEIKLDKDAVLKLAFLKEYIRMKEKNLESGHQ